MKLRIINCAIIMAVITVGGLSAFGQQAKMAPLSVHRSTLVEQLKGLRSSDPRLTADEFAEAANIILDKVGMNFSISLDPASCELLRARKAAQKDPSEPLRISGKLNSVDADTASLSLPEISFAAKDCGGCFVELPLLEITDKTLVTIISGRNIKFHLPSNFFVNEVRLVDTSDPNLTKRKWRVPSRLSPIGVSYDENVLYLAFDEPELAELSLVVFGEGTFQIGTRPEAEEGGKGKPQGAAAGSSHQTIKFDRWEKSYVLSYRSKCGV